MRRRRAEAAAAPGGDSEEGVSSGRATRRRLQRRDDRNRGRSRRTGARRTKQLTQVWRTEVQMADFTAKDVAELRKRTGAGILDCRKALGGGGRRSRRGRPAAARAGKGERRQAAEPRPGRRRRGRRGRERGRLGFGRRHRRSRVRDRLRRQVCRVRPARRRARRRARHRRRRGALEEQRERVEKLAVDVQGEHRHRPNGALRDAARVGARQLPAPPERPGRQRRPRRAGGGSQELAHDIAVHIAFARPEYLRREDVPAELVEAERKTAEAIARNEGKPEAALPKIVEGRLNGWFKERCLLEQAYVRDEKRTIADLLGDVGAEALRSGRRRILRAAGR